MQPRAYPNRSTRRPYRRPYVRRSRSQIFFDTLLGPPGHRRPALYPFLIVVLIVLPALALAGRPAIPTNDRVDRGQINTVTTVNRPLR